MSILFAAAGGLLKLVQEKRGPPDQQGQGGGSSGQGAYGPQGGGGGGGGPSSMLGGGRGLGNNKLFALYKFAESSVGNRGQQQQQSGEDAYGGRQQQQQQQQYGPGAAASGSGYAPMAPVEEYTPPPEPTMSCGQFVESLIAQNRVMVFSREESQQGAQVKRFFETNYSGLHVEVFDIHPDDPMIQPYLVERSKTAAKYNGKKKIQTDVPYVFIDNVYIGGLAELQAIRKADLQGLLQQRR